MSEVTFGQGQLEELAKFTDPQNEIIANLAKALLTTTKQRNEFAQQLSELQLSQSNIINAFGIKGEGAHSKLVIEYVYGLVAENARMREAIAFATAPDMWQEQHDGMLDYRYVDWYVDVLNAALEPKSADAAIAEIKAQGVDEFLNDEFVQEVAMRLADFNGETEESVSTVVWSGMPPEPEGNVWELEYVSRASFLSRKLKEFAANLRAGRNE